MTIVWFILGFSLGGLTCLAITKPNVGEIQALTNKITRLEKQLAKYTSAERNPYD